MVPTNPVPDSPLEIARALQHATSQQATDALLAPLLPQWVKEPKLATTVLKGALGHVALKILQAMSRSMMETNSIHFNAAIAAAELHGEWQTALQLLRRMLAEKDRVQQLACPALPKELPTHQLVPDSFSYSAVIKGLKQGLLWQLALALFNHMPRGLRDKVCYNSAIASMPLRGGLMKHLLGDQQELGPRALP